MTAQTINGNTRKPYNDKPLREGEVLVPQMVIDRWYAISIGGNPRNFRTWTLAGVRYTVMFVPVRTDEVAISMKDFTDTLNELLDEKLGPNRHSRCLIPQPDGSVKVCPKVSGNNHAPCSMCPHRGEYEREDRSVVSLDELAEEDFTPMECVPSAESLAMDSLLLEALLNHLRSINPVMADIVSMGYSGLEKKDIVKRLGVKSSQAYELCAKAEKLVREFLLR